MSFLRSVLIGTVGGLIITGVNAYLQRREEDRAASERDAEHSASPHVADNILIYVSRTEGGDAAEPFEMILDGELFTFLPPHFYKLGVVRSGDHLLTVRLLGAPEDSPLTASLTFHGSPQETLAFTTALATDDQNHSTVVLTREPDIDTGMKRIAYMTPVADEVVHRYVSL